MMFDKSVPFDSYIYIDFDKVDLGKCMFKDRSAEIYSMICRTVVNIKK